MADKTISYDVFFRVGENGLGEHIQVTSDSIETLMKDRDSIQLGLAALGAVPLARDTGPGYNAQKQAPAQPAPDYGKNNPNRLKNSTPTCPECGAEMRLVEPTAGKTWPAFWSCSNYRSTGCKGKRQA